jgi:hypothetical protein
MTHIKGQQENIIQAGGQALWKKIQKAIISWI